MDEPNPYQPPAAEVADQPDNMEAFELAERGTRLSAYVIDGLVYIFPFLGVIVMAITADTASTENVMASVWGIIAFAGVLAILIANAVLLHRNGQTIGKRVLNIRIVRGSGERAGLARLLLIRYFAMGLITSIPYVGTAIWIADPLFIFRESRRCLHDQLADTIVIKG